MFNFNFYGWGFNMSNLDDLLSKQQLTTDQILDHDNIVSEVKQSSTKFGNFIKKRPVLIKKMIDYIFMNEKESLSLGLNDPKKCNKYPFISSEILGCENPGVIDCFFQEFSRQNQLTRNQQEEEQDENGEQQHKGDDDDEEEEEEDEEYENTQNNKNNGQQQDVLDTKVEDTLDQQVNQEDQQTHQMNPEASDNHQSIEQDELKEGEPSEVQKDSDAQETPETEDDSDENYFFKGCLLDYLMNKFASSKSEINTTCIGYMQRILNALINKNGVKFFEHVLPKQNFVFDLVENLNNRSMAEILTRFILIDSPDIENRQYPLFIEERRLILDCLFKRFQESTENEELENITFVFTEVLIKIDKCLNSKKILESLYSPSNLKIVFEKMFDQVDDQFNSSYISYCSQILKQLLTLFLKPQSPDEQRYSEENSPTKQSDDDVVVTNNNAKDHANLIQQANFQNFLNLISLYAGKMLALLDSNGPSALTCVDPYMNQTREKMVPLGLGKFQLVEFIEVCLRVSDNEPVQASLVSNNVFGVLLHLMLRYPFHNLLHNIIVSIIEQQIFNDNENNQIYLKNIIEEAHFLEFLKDQMIDQYSLSDPSNHVQQFETQNKIFGQLFKLARKLYKEQEKNDNDRQKEVLNSLIYQKPEWKDLKEQLITKLDNFYNKDIAGENPRAPKTNSEEATKEEQDDQQVLLEIQKIYQKFNQFNYMKSNNDDQEEGDIEDKERNFDQTDNEVNDGDNQYDNSEELKYNDLESDNQNQQTESQGHTVEEAEYVEHKEEDAYLSNKYWDNKDLNTFNVDDLIKDL